MPITRISALYAVAYTTDIDRSISLVYATAYNADIRVIGTNTAYYPSSHPTVLSRFRCLVHNHPHTQCHAESGGFSFHAVAEPLRLSLSVLPGPQWLDVLPSTWAFVSVEVLPLQNSFATGHSRLGVSCIVPGGSCPSTSRNTMQASVTTFL